MTYQLIILKFSNGKEVKASVPSFCTVQEIKEGIYLVGDIGITAPMDMPKGCRFDTIKIE